MSLILTHALAFLAGVYVGATAVALCVAASRRTPRPTARIVPRPSIVLRTGEDGRGGR